jgi:predicted transcriptional regulator
MAARAGTAQSVVARIETGVTDPSSGLVRRLLGAAGLEVRCRLEPAAILETHMLDHVERILAMTPEDRLLEVRNFSRLMAKTRELGGP